MLHLAKAIFFLADGQPPIVDDSLGYWKLGRLLSQGHGFSGHWSLFRPPGQPLFLALSQWLCGEHALIAAAALQQLGIVATALLSGWICARLTGSRSGLLLGLAVPLLGIRRNYVGLQMLADNLLCLTFTLALACLVRWIERPSRALACAIGLAIGASTLTKPVMQLAWLPILAVMALRLRGGGARTAARRFLAHAGWLVAAMTLVVGPWVVRNDRVHGEPFLVKFNGRAFWISAFDRCCAQLPFSEGPATARAMATIAGAGVDLHSTWGVYKALRQAGLAEGEADDLMWTVTREAILEHPLPFAGSVVRSFAHFWTSAAGRDEWHRNDRDWAGGGYEGQRTWQLAPVVALHQQLDAATSPYRERVYAAALLVSVLSAILLLARPETRLAATALCALAAYVGLAVAAAGTHEYRYRMILEPLLATVVASGGIVAARGRSASSHRTPRAATSAPRPTVR